MILQNQKIIDLLAVAVSEAMPFRSVLRINTVSRINTNQKDNSWLTQKNCFNPAMELVYFDLNYENQIWMPRVLPDIKTARQPLIFVHNLLAPDNKSLLESCLAQEVK